MAEGNGMTQTSVQYQLYTRRSNGYFLPTYPAEFFPKYEHAVEAIGHYQAWERKHEVRKVEYKIMKGTTIVEECDAGN